MRPTLRLENKRMAGTGMDFPASVPASIKGWNAISSIANMPEDFAVQLDNFIPRPGYLEIRRGCSSYASGIGTSSTPVQTVMPYNSPNTATTKLFAASGTTIYDITAGATASATTVTGLSSSRLQALNFTNASDITYLLCANGLDAPPIFNGTSWSTFAAAGFPVSTIIQFAGWKRRLWWCYSNSTQVGYMPVDQIAGTAATLDLGPLMTRGGYINSIATWTVDTKQSVDEYLAFISSTGQVFVYEGTDPTTADTFALVGVYNLGAPIGRRPFLRISGNLWIITQDGVIPMTEMLTQVADQTVAARVAVTSTIMNAINQAVQNYANNFGWQFISYPRGTLAVLNIPTVENDTAIQYVMNTITGAWCRFLGLNANCWALYNEMLYFGANDGRVYKWDVGSGDYVNATPLPITGTVQTAFNYFKTRGWTKRFTAIRPLINTDGTVTPGVGINVDFGTTGQISTPSTFSSSGAQWDVAIWDQALWPPNSSLVANWTTVDGIGKCASVITQVVTADNGNANGVTLQLNGWDMTMEKGNGFY